MNLTQLRYFVAVAEKGSVSTASESLHISQPSLSAVIKELEKEFGVPLFRRHYKGMALTQEGEELNKLAKSLLEHSEQVERVMTDMGAGRKILRLGVPPMIGSIMLPKIYGEFAKENPSVQLEITEAGRQELTELLAKDRIDMILCPHKEEFGKEYRAHKIAEFEIVCCVNAKNALSKKTKVTAKDLSDEPLVMFNDGFFQTQEIKKWFEENGVKPKVLLQTSQLSTLTNVIKSNVVSGFTFKEFIEQDGVLTAVEMDKPVLAIVSLVWKAGATVFNSMKTFLSFIKRV